MKLTYFRKFDLMLDETNINEVEEIEYTIKRNNNKIKFIVNGDKNQLEVIYFGKIPYQNNFQPQPETPMNRLLAIIVLLFSIIILPGCIVVPGPIGVIGEYGAVTVQPNPVVVSSGYTGTYYNYTGRVQAVNIAPYYSNPPIYSERPVVRNYYAPQVYVPPPLSSTGVIINTGGPTPPFYPPPPPPPPPHH